MIEDQKKEDHEGKKRRKRKRTRIKRINHEE